MVAPAPAFLWRSTSPTMPKTASAYKPRGLSHSQPSTLTRSKQPVTCLSSVVPGQTSPSFCTMALLLQNRSLATVKTGSRSVSCAAGTFAHCLLQRAARFSRAAAAAVPRGMCILFWSCNVINHHDTCSEPAPEAPTAIRQLAATDLAGPLG